MKKYRRKGIALSILKELFNQKKGKYFVVELTENKPAVHFWKKTFLELNIEYEEEKKIVDDEKYLIHSFEM